MYNLIYGLVWSLSKLPFCVLYVIADVIYFLAYYVARYRRKVVRDNLTSAFPNRSVEEIKKIERNFYHFFADYIVETIKLLTISEKQMMERMEMTGVSEMIDYLKEHNKTFGFIYLAHYGNWEWVSSLAKRIHNVDSNISTGQIYHPLRNKHFNRLFLFLRNRFEGENIAMKETLRYIINKKRSNEMTIIGFIADQAPKWNSIHHWTDFLNHKTPVFTGTEQIAKQVDAALFYGDVERVSRGHYKLTITPMTSEPKAVPDYDITDEYFRLLEATIEARPAIWLWSHKRWKRTYEEFLERQAVKGKEA